MTASSQKIACILGPGRSGTSLVGQLLKSLGFNLGSDTNLQAHKHFNILGTWEHTQFSRINDSILRRLGCNVNVPPPLNLDARWATHRSFDDLNCQARSLIEKEFSKSANWGWKDPKTCLTLPFWQSVISNAVYIICLRNPLDMATSFMRLSGYTMQRCLSICFLYTAHSLLHTRGKRRMVLFFEDLINEPDIEIRRLSEFLGLPHGRSLSCEALNMARGIIHNDLSHYRTPFETFVNCTLIPHRLRNLYCALYLKVQHDRSLVSDADKSVLAGLSFEALLDSLISDTGRSGYLSAALQRATGSVPLGLRQTYLFYCFNRIAQVYSQAGLQDVVSAVFRAIQQKPA